MTDHPPRSFAVGRSGETTELSAEDHLTLMGVSPKLSAAYDICDDAGLDMEKWAPLLAVAEREGEDVEAFARRAVKLAQAFTRASRR